MTFSLLLVSLFLAPLSADEGMWTFHGVPAAKIAETYGFSPSQAWLDHVRLSSVHVGEIGSGAFVSPDGLVLTNQHVALSAIGKLSSPDRDYVTPGFYARGRDKELKLRDTEINVLVEMEDVTEAVRAAVEGAPSVDEANKRRKAEIERIAKEAEQASGQRCQVVSLYQGGEYWLYRYKRFTDVRLVFAPEARAAYFGGDNDNFTFPRHDLDFTFLRVYENGLPYRSEHYLRWNPRGAKDGDPVFVTGHPGSTQRLKTVSQLESIRDIEQPLAFDSLKRTIAALETYAKTGEEPKRQAYPLLRMHNNTLKRLEGQRRALKDPVVLAAKAFEEARLRRAVDADPKLSNACGSAWDRITNALADYAAWAPAYFHRRLRGGPLVTLAQHIVFLAQEREKNNDERWPEYQDSALKSLNLILFSPAPTYPAMEIPLLAAHLKGSLEALGPEDPFVKAALAGRTPEEAARTALAETKIFDPVFRERLLDGGLAAVEASEDPLIRLVLAGAPHQRVLRTWHDDAIEAVVIAAGAAIAQARFAVYGKSVYPDGTFTLRLAYGQVAGYEENFTRVPYKTTFHGLYARSAAFDGKEPYDLPPRVAFARSRVNLDAPLDFAYTGDTIGGNSGSPLLDKEGRLVGLNFDGNIAKLGNAFAFPGGAARAVAVHAAAILEALINVYDARPLADELVVNKEKP